jgi:hypothetical protein
MTFLLVIVLKHVFGSAGRNGSVGKGEKALLEAFFNLEDFIL